MLDKLQKYFDKSPELKVHHIDPSQKNHIINHATRKGYLVADLDGKKIPDIEKLCKEVGEQMHFPSYYGENWGAMGECIGDLDWDDDPDWMYGEIAGALVVIKNFDNFLSKEKDGLSSEFISLLRVANRDLYSPPDCIEGAKSGRMIKVFIID